MFFTIVCTIHFIEGCMPFAAFITDYPCNWACVVAKPLLSFGVVLRTNVINFCETIKHCKELPFKKFLIGGRTRRPGDGTGGGI